MNKSATNYDMAAELIARTDNLISQKAYYEAVILQTALIEHLLRLSIINLTPNDPSYKRFFDPDIRLFNLINYWYLTCEETEIFKKLDKYRTERNKLVHKILTYNNLTDLNTSSKTTYLLGEKIIDSLKKIEPFKTMVDNFKNSPKIRYYRKKPKGKLKLNFP